MKQFGLQFGMRLKKARVRKNITRKVLAHKVGVHTNTYGLYERGKRVPDAIIIKMVCDILQVNYIWLFTGQGPIDMPNNSAGIETGLLENIIVKVEEHLSNSSMILSPAKKAEIISILYDDALEKMAANDSYIFVLEKSLIRFLNLLAERQG